MEHIVIMTPWREDCFDRMILETEKNVTHIALPVEAGENDPLGRAPGDALCPEIGKDNRWLEEFRESYIHDPKGGSRAWAAMYMCSPRVLEGNLVRREWWRFYDTFACPRFDQTAVSVDATFKGSDTGDFVAIQVWSRAGADYYLRYSVNEHLDFPQTVQKIREVCGIFPEARPVIIEEAANGAAIIATLRTELPVLPVKPVGGKVARVNAVSMLIETGHVFLPDPALHPWVEDYLDQFTAFPTAAHDDMVDSTSQVLTYFVSHSSGTAEEQRDTVELSTVEEQLFDVYG